MVAELGKELHRKLTRRSDPQEEGMIVVIARTFVQIV